MCVPCGQYGNIQELLEGNWFGDCHKVPPNKLDVKYGYQSIVIQQYVFESAMMALLEDPFDIFFQGNRPNLVIEPMRDSVGKVSDTTVKVTARI